MGYAEYLGREDGGTNGASREVAVASGVTVYGGEFAYESAGFLTSASIAGKKLLGLVQGGNSRYPLRVRGDNTANEQTTGDGTQNKKVLVNMETSGRYLVKANGALTASQEGLYFGLTGNAGSQLVSNTSGSASGQLQLIKANPLIRGTKASDNYGIFRIASQQVESDSATTA